MRYQTDHKMVDKIKDLVAQGLSSKEIGLIVGKSPKAVQKYFSRHGIQPALKRGGPIGERNGGWNGGQTIDKDGYRLIRSNGHPAARETGYVLEHRLVMEQKIGRYLDKKEVVHHIDGNKLNNHPDNLELFEENRIHLQHELTGRIPDWSEQGYLNMKAPRPHAKSRFVSEEEKNWLKQRPRLEDGTFAPSHLWPETYAAQCKQYQARKQS